MSPFIPLRILVDFIKTFNSIRKIRYPVVGAGVFME